MAAKIYYIDACTSWNANAWDFAIIKLIRTCVCGMQPKLEFRCDMKLKFAKAFILLLLFNHAYAKEWLDKKVGAVQVNAANGCLYFALDGVAEADPVTPGQPWMTLEPDNISQKEILSLLMLAYASKVDVKVVTTGLKTPVCGYSQVQYVRLQ